MLHLYLMSAIVALASSADYNFKQQKIVGGRETSIEEHPYQVSIQKLIGINDIMTRMHSCGGSLIKPDIVLTAAHCMQSPVEEYEVKAGSTHKSSGGLRFAILEYINHPKYKYETYDYDVSIIKLNGKFRLDSSIKIISLIPEGMAVAEGTIGITTGWGRDDDLGHRPENLRIAEVPKLNQFQCTLLYEALGYPVTSRMTCYGMFSGGPDACQGDSGGPLVVGIYLVGIVSWGVGCGVANQPGVYTNLDNQEIRQFIFSNLLED